MDAFANPFTHVPAEYPRDVYGMNPGFRAQFVQG